MLNASAGVLETLGGKEVMPLKEDNKEGDVISRE